MQAIGRIARRHIDRSLRAGQRLVFSFSLPLADRSSLPLSQGPDHPGQRTDGTGVEPAGFTFANPTTGELAATVPIPPLLPDGNIHILAVDDDPVNLNVLVGISSSDVQRCWLFWGSCKHYFANVQKRMRLDFNAHIQFIQRNEAALFASSAGVRSPLGPFMPCIRSAAIF